MKKFRLEKDMPNIKSGAIFYEKKTSHEELRTYHIDSDDFGHPFFLMADTVENNLEWFSIIDTEELMRESLSKLRSQPNQIFIKPPIGILPRYIHEEQRIESIKGAMNKYINENKKFPTEWLEEYNELIGRRENKSL